MRFYWTYIYTCISYRKEENELPPLGKIDNSKNPLIEEFPIVVGGKKTTHKKLISKTHPERIFCKHWVTNSFWMKK